MLSAQAAAQQIRGDLPPETSDLIAQTRALMPAHDGPPLFSASWGREGDHRFGGGLTADGRMWQSGATLREVLGHTMETWAPGSAAPTAFPTLLFARVDGPSDLLARPVRLAVRQPGLDRETAGPFLRERLGVALGFHARLDRRPEAVYALRATPQTALPPPTGTEREGWVVSDSHAEFGDQSMPEVARALGAAIGLHVVDETGLNGRTSFALDLDPSIVDFEDGPLGVDAIDALRAALLDATGLELVPTVGEVPWVVVRVPDE